MTKTFGFWTLVFLVIANMIGAGVFTTSGFSLQDLGTAHFVMLAWAVGGAIAVAGAVSYGMLIKAMPESGGEYLFLSRALHPLFGFIAGWVSLIAGFSGAIAFAATAFESYLLPDGARPSWLPVGSVAVVAILLAGAFHGLKPAAGAWLQNGVVILKLGLLAAILMFAAAKIPTDLWQGLPADQASTADDSALDNGAQDNGALAGRALATAFAGSLVWISLSYSGFNAAVYVASEVENADRTVPKALVTGTVIVVGLYLLLNAVFVYAPSPESIRGQPDVAAIAAKSLGGASFEKFVRSTISLCLLTSVFSMMMAAPRVYAKMADDGVMPQRLRFQGGSPLVATAVQVVLAIGLVLATSLQGLLSYLGLTLSLSAACSVSCLLLPSVRTRPLANPLHLMPLTYVACTLIAAFLMAVANPWQLVGTVVTFFVGAVAYAITRLNAESNRHSPPKSETVP